jgi:glycosyltransferase involved in cell wall biosynthesis
VTEQVVISAFACDPNLPSEPTIGWEYLKTWLKIAASDDLHVTLFTNDRSAVATRDRMEEELIPADRLSLRPVRLPAALKVLEHPRLTRLEYLVWCVQVRRQLRQEEDPNVLLARHVTFASELLPTPISALKARAFRVWGPVGSSGEARVYLVRPRHLHWRQQYLVQRLRDAASSVLARQHARGVDLTMTTSSKLADRLEAKGSRAVVFPNTRLGDDLLDHVGSVARSETDRSGDTDSVTLLCVGNLITLKRFEIVIAALRDPRLRQAHLRIAGKALGGEDYLPVVARDLGVADRVTFLGQVSRTIVLDEMSAADVVIHPSAREGASGVVGEATAIGTPVVCFAGTGGAAVLDFAGGSGVLMDASHHADNELVASAIIDALSTPRRASPIWFADRYEDYERELLSLARQKHS